MDRVRFGRALGSGARDAARALLKAADAAAAPNPAPPAPAQAPAPTQPPVPSGPQASPSPQRPHSVPVAARLRRGSKNFGQSVWAPLTRQSGVLWLEFTGVFFGLFAVTAALATWKHRHDLLIPTPARPQALFALAMFLVFGYFTFSSFLKASRRSRG